MIEIYKKIENWWFAKFPQKARFLLVGGFNTAAAYLIFVGLYYLFAERYTLSLSVQYVVSINISIVTMRHYVFRSHGKFAKEYFKAAGVYAYMLLFNMVWLAVFVEHFGMNAVASQALWLVISTICTYVLHKYFSFREKI